MCSQANFHGYLILSLQFPVSSPAKGLPCRMIMTLDAPQIFPHHIYHSTGFKMEFFKNFLVVFEAIDLATVVHSLCASDDS